MKENNVSVTKCKSGLNNLRETLKEKLMKGSIELDRLDGQQMKSHQTEIHIFIQITKRI